MPKPEEIEEEGTAVGLGGRPNLKRRRSQAEEEEPGKPKMAVSTAVMDRIADVLVAPSGDILPSFTVIDKFQGRLFPLIDMINVIWDDILQIAQYRQDKEEYKKIYKKAKPVSLNWLAGLLTSTAVWQKSIGGMNLRSLGQLALAETEARAGDEGEGFGGGDIWEKDEP